MLYNVDLYILQDLLFLDQKLKAMMFIVSLFFNLLNGARAILNNVNIPLSLS